MVKKAFYVIMCASIVCLNCQNSLQAQNFSSWWHAARSSVANVLRHPLIKPAGIGLVAAAVVGAVGYCIKSSYDKRKEAYDKKREAKKRSNNVENSVTFGQLSVPGKAYTLHTENGIVRIGQVEVLNQFTAGGCGVASCGYQALKNAVGIASLVKGVDWRAWLSDQGQAAVLFGLKSKTEKPGFLREAIIRYRQGRLLRNAIEERVPVDRGGAENDPLRPAYLDVYPALFHSYCDELIEQVLAGNDVDVTLDSLVAWIRKQPNEQVVALNEHRVPAEGDELAAAIKDRNTIAAYFGLGEKASYKFSANMLNAKLVSDYRNKTGQDLGLNGEWLHENEVNDLYRLLQQKHDHLKDVNLTTAEVYSEKIAPRVLQVQQGIKAKNLLKNVYPFALNVGGHWETVVLDTRTDGIRRYTLADSASGGASKLHGGELIDFIAQLEGNTIFQHVPKNEDLVDESYGFGKYCAQMWKRLKRVF